MSKQRELIKILKDKIVLEDKNIIKANLPFINALTKAGFVSLEKAKTLGQPVVKVTLVKKDIGDNIIFNRGILKDFDNKTVFKINADADKKEYNKQLHNEILIALLKAIIDLNKDTLTKAELVTKALDFKEFQRAAATRWINFLKNLKVLVEDGNFYRNSPVFLVNISKAIRALENIEVLRDYRLLS
jgi:hypothetical protein